MPSTDRTPGPLTVQDLLDLARDPRPRAQYRTLTGFDTSRLRALEDRLGAALPHLVEAREREEIVGLRVVVRRILTLRNAKTTYEQLLQEAV